MLLQTSRNTLLLFPVALLFILASINLGRVCLQPLLSNLTGSFMITQHLGQPDRLGLSFSGEAQGDSRHVSDPHSASGCLGEGVKSTLFFFKVT